MNERYDGPQGPEQEVTDEQKRRLIEKARALAPFKNQPVDRFGAYETRILYGEDEGYVSIYIPGLAEAEDLDGLIDDSLRIIKRIPEHLDGGTTIVHSAMYRLNVLTLEAEYSEDEHAFDTETGERVGPRPNVDNLESFMQAYQMSQQFRVSPVFTDERLQEVNELLDSLDPNDTF